MKEDQQPNKPHLPKGYVPYPTASYKRYIGWHMLASYLCQAIFLIFMEAILAEEISNADFDTILGAGFFLALPALLSGWLSGLLVKFFNLRKNTVGKIMSVVVGFIGFAIIFVPLVRLYDALSIGSMLPYITAIVIGELIATFMLFDLLPALNAEYENEDSTDTLN